MMRPLRLGCRGAQTLGPQVRADVARPRHKTPDQLFRSFWSTFLILRPLQLLYKLDHFGLGWMV